MEYNPSENIMAFFAKLNKTRWPITDLCISDDGQHILIRFRDGSKFIISETSEDI